MPKYSSDNVNAIQNKRKVSGSAACVYWVIPATLPKPLGLVITRPNLSFSFIQYLNDRFKIGTVPYRVVKRLAN